MADTTLSEEALAEIARVLAEKGVRKTCPMCGHEWFDAAEGFSAMPLHKDKQEAVNLFGTRTVIPAVVLACSNCGFLSHHALGTLGLMGLFRKEEQV